ncbi:hypothetical protein ACWOFR_03480 [Carnobacterium gallinarum]|uniref:hypothetical protein n=1 Tax=Carnobacterium gallinarum TaxID=2749 RepID=UPI0005520053|nr:hypothetical protein [Carnobacterium gallinarum]
MAIIKIYIHPKKEVDSYLVDLDLEKEFSLINEEFEEWLVKNTSNLEFDCIDYLSDLEQHYLCYFVTNNEKQACQELEHLLAQELPIKSEFIIEIGYFSDWLHEEEYQFWKRIIRK